MGENLNDDEHFLDGITDDYDSDDIIMRFVFKKGEGDWPTIEELSESEKADPVLITKFIFDWNPEGADGYNFNDLEIKEAQFLYDGVSYLSKSDLGIRVVENALIGYPAPIIRFKLSHPVSVNAFTRAVWSSSVNLTPESRVDSEEDPFYCEDHNGYTTAIDMKAFNTITNNEIALIESPVVTINELTFGIELHKVRTSPF